MREAIQVLLDSDITGYEIHKETGISQSVISELRRGKRDLGNLSLNYAEKLYYFQRKYLKSDYDQDIPKAFSTIEEQQKRNDLTEEQKEFITQTRMSFEDYINCLDNN
ncbi:MULTISPECIES: hypothetical protein [Mammaliicoccus]|uniref:hypothetical protein n=1 Tax=Mammaliicoccus TaxID=2803850 RepID=UPI0011C8214C|nr:MULTISPECIES: hypothetical protein [Mammaliicoccus]